MVEADLVGPLKAKKVDLFHAWVAWVGAVSAWVVPTSPTTPSNNVVSVW